MKDEAVKKREEAQEHRDAVNEGKETLKPSDFKARSAHLKKLKGIGDQWKAITGVDQPRYADNASPGYNHEVYWKNIVKDGKVL